MAGETAPAKLGSVFLQAVISNVLNPKVVLFFLAFLPQFADPAAGGAAPLLLAFGLTFTLLTWIIFSVLCYFSGSLGNWLVSRPKLADRLRWLTGGVFIGLGRRLALPDQR